MSIPSMASGPTICQIVPSARLNGIKFELMTGEEMEMFSSISVLEVNDLVDAKLGLPSTSSQCTTCGSRSIKECDGHFGVIKLPIAVYHPYLIPEIVHMLNQICPGCKSFRHEARTKRRLFHSVRKKLLRYISLRLSRLTRKVLSGDLKDDIPYMKIKRHITEEVGAMKNKSGCRYCDGSSVEWYPTMKFKISNRDMQGRKCLSIVAEVSEKLPKKFQSRSFGELPADYWNFVPKFHKQQGINSNSIILSPWQVFYLLKQLDRDFINQFVSRRELLFLSCLPVTPNSHRIVETTRALTDGTRISFDERTKVYKRVADLGKKLDGVLQHPQFRALTSSFVADRVRDCFVSSKLRSHSSSSKDSPSSVSGMKWLKEVILSKRSDYAFRMTMVGDPKLRLDEVGIPYNIAGSLFVTEYVNTFNLEKLRSSYGIRLWRNQKLIFNRKSNQLQIGDKIERPLADGDIVLVNRPPSVHQHSLIALSVRTLPSDSVVSINPICCAPLLGDFDGDCLHGYVPQSIRCRVELQELVSLDNQLLNGQNGRNLLSLTHDSLTAAHFLTAKDAFFNKFEIQQLEMLCPHQSPLPAIITGPNLEGPFWTGYQLLNMLFPPSMGIHEDPRNVHGSKGKVLVAPHGVLCLQDKPNSIFYRMARSYGEKSLDYLFSAQEVLCEYLSMRGLTVSLGDIYLTMDSYTRMKMNEELSFGLQEAADACRAIELLLNKVDSSINPLAETEDLSLSRSLHKGTWSRTRISQDSIIAFKNIFCDVQNVIHNYIGRNNSLLAMINAGSKGSLLKLVQQGACLGMQLSASEILFNIPRVLSCVQWNEQKKLDQSGVLNAYDDGDFQKHFVVIKSSLLDGLNPLECLFHSISGRANLFSENAQLPGTLSRKLMFYMRDLYVAYDGTVRNVYGEEIVQFYYNFAEGCQFSNFSSDREVSVSIPGGQPVGSWAACSMCETAYGALECPMNPLCPSPLMKLKTILESSTAKSYGGYTASLFLSNKLQRVRYGFELGALEVKNQLEKVFFTDIVTTVKILYAGKDTEGLNVSPWIMRFYVDEERMIRRRLDVDLLKDQLQRNYAKRTIFDDSLPKLCIENKWFLSGDKQERLGAINCITVGVKLVDSPDLLDTIRDLVIPCLLHSLVKGFSEFEKVDILWDDSQKNSSDELFLKVTMSENCPVGKFWSTIQNACIPIMNLIDWNRSLPDDMCNISSMFGINLAWISFLKSLKSSALDVGRNVHQAHLNIVADRLFVSGVFHGLNRRGLKEQRDHTTTSSPFTLACFSNPASCFIDAAKQDCKDSLRGSVDAVSWGKESPTGTGGPFEIIYSGKVCNPMERESIYSVLHFQDIQKKMVNPSHANDICNANTWNENCFTKYKEDAEFSFQRKFSSRNVSYTHILNMESSLRAILLKYPVNRYVTAADREILMKALAFHTSSDAKIGIGVQDIKVGYSSEHRGSKCFIVVRKDGTTEDFSYHKCVAGAAARVSLECAAMIEKKYQEKFRRSSRNH